MKLIGFFSLFIFCCLVVVAQPVQFSRDPFGEITELTVFDDPNNQTKTMVVKLTGIIWDDDRPAAVLDISGTTYVVYEKTTVFWLKVTRITQSSVVLEGNEEQYMVKLGEEIVP